MNLKLISSQQNRHPRCGLFIEGTQLEGWLEALDQLAIDPSMVQVYGLPSKVANVLWGCLVMGEASAFQKEFGPHLSAHQIANRLIIPEKSDVYPTLTPFDLKHLFQEKTFVFHPEIGLFQLEAPIDWKDHLDTQAIVNLDPIAPTPYAWTTPTIHSFRIEATPIEELKAEMINVPQQEETRDKPLNFQEKLKYKLYQQFFNIEEDTDGERVTLKPNASNLEKLAQQLGLGDENTKESMMQDFRDLHNRNKKELEKLMDLLKKNPEEALRYAIPLDETGYDRGLMNGQFKMTDRGIDLSLFGQLQFGGAGAGIDLGDDYFRLRTQYINAAQALVDKGEYEKAAFVYMRLLKEYHQAAEILRKGGLYEKAALVYLEYAKDELKAAACYEEAQIYNKAIELYQKNEQFEKVGDLYIRLNKRKKANQAYQKVVDQYLVQSRYLQASFLSRDKMQDLPQTQVILLEGWRKHIDAFNCLNNYLNNLEDPKEVWSQIEILHGQEVNQKNEKIFLDVLKYEFKKHPDLKSNIRELAYRMISDLLERNKISSNELLAFNAEDRRLSADTIRYEVNKNKRRVE